jgi:hypothetical protein
MYVQLCVCKRQSLTMYVRVCVLSSSDPMSYIPMYVCIYIYHMHVKILDTHTINICTIGSMHSHTL